MSIVNGNGAVILILFGGCDFGSVVHEVFNWLWKNSFFCRNVFVFYLSNNIVHQIYWVLSEYITLPETKRFSFQFSYLFFTILKKTNKILISLQGQYSMDPKARQKRVVPSIFKRISYLKTHLLKEISLTLSYRIVLYCS